MENQKDIFDYSPDDILKEFNLDVGIDNDFDLPENFSSGENKEPTFDKFKDKVKIFLLENKIITDPEKHSYQIIYNFVKDFKLPKKNEVFRIRTQQQINLFAILAKIIYEHKIIDELTIGTYTLNKNVFNPLMLLLDSGKIKRLNLLLASSYSFRSPDNYEMFKAVCLDKAQNGKEVKLVFAWSHFKITLVKCGEYYYHFEGSMNYSMNNMAENIILSESEYIYQQDYDFIKNTMTSRNNKALEIVC